MPIYEYRRPDGTTFELQQSFSDDPLLTDPETGVAVQRVLHAPALHFKGKGFYNTDYGTRKRERETAAAAAGSSSAKDSSADRSTSAGSSSPSDSSSGSAKEGTAGGQNGGKDAAKSKDSKLVPAKS